MFPFINEGANKGFAHYSLLWYDMPISGLKARRAGIFPGKNRVNANVADKYLAGIRHE